MQLSQASALLGSGGSGISCSLKVDHLPWGCGLLLCPLGGRPHLARWEELVTGNLCHSPSHLPSQKEPSPRCGCWGGAAEVEGVTEINKMENFIDLECAQELFPRSSSSPLGYSWEGVVARAAWPRLALPCQGIGVQTWWSVAALWRKSRGSAVALPNSAHLPYSLGQAALSWASVSSSEQQVSLSCLSESPGCVQMGGP